MPGTRSLRAVGAAISALGVAATLVACGDQGEAAAQLANAPRCADVDLSTPPQEPVEIRLGVQPSTIEPLQIQYVDPEFAGAEHYGEWYTVDATTYAPADRLDAFQAGQIDGGTASAPQLIRAVAQGLPLRVAASITTESSEGFTTKFATLSDSGITDLTDLKGKRIGILDPVTSTAYWARSTVAGAGLNPDRDVEFVTIPVAEQEKALRAGTIDVAVLPQPFFDSANSNGGIEVLFDSRTGPGIDQELIDAFFGVEFIANNPEAYCAWRADYQSAVSAYQQDRATAVTTLNEAEAIRVMDLEAFIKAEDYTRPEDGKIDLANLDAMIDNMADVGFLKPNQTVPAADLVAEGYSLVK